MMPSSGRSAQDGRRAVFDGTQQKHFAAEAYRDRLNPKHLAKYSPIQAFALYAVTGFQRGRLEGRG